MNRISMHLKHLLTGEPISVPIRPVPGQSHRVRVLHNNDCALLHLGKGMDVGSVQKEVLRDGFLHLE